MYTAKAKGLKNSSLIKQVMFKKYCNIHSLGTNLKTAWNLDSFDVLSNFLILLLIFLLGAKTERGLYHKTF